MVILAFLAVTACGSGPKADPSPLSPWTFQVNIISGSRAGQTWTGSLVLPPEDSESRGEVRVPARSFEFHYADKTFLMQDCDDIPMVRLVDGVPQEILVTGGPHELRFGFNAGFRREQFHRISERFILEGQSYFGYLNPETYVDGAGKVTFVKP